MSLVLAVDDEPQLLRALITNLRARGYEVDAATTGEIALELAARHHPDVVVLDLGLPAMSGIDVIHGLRGWSEVPIIVLSARDAERDKIAALDAGADDYVTKPFGMGELLARVRAALRRSAPTTEEATVVTRRFTIDLAAKRVTNDAGEVRLTPTEWHLVEMLVRNAGKLVTQGALLREVWGPEYGTETNYLRVYMAHIRRKLEPDPAHPQLLHHRARHGLPVRGSRRFAVDRPPETWRAHSKSTSDCARLQRFGCCCTWRVQTLDPNLRRPCRCRPRRLRRRVVDPQGVGFHLDLDHGAGRAIPKRRVHQLPEGPRRDASGRCVRRLRRSAPRRRREWCQWRERRGWFHPAERSQWWPPDDLDSGGERDEGAVGVYRVSFEAAERRSLRRRRGWSERGRVARVSLVPE